LAVRKSAWQKKKKTSARSPALASARIAPKICQGQLQTIYSEFPKFHPNPFTSGGLIAERVNIVETCHKVFPILGEASSEWDYSGRKGRDGQKKKIGNANEKRKREKVNKSKR